MLFNSYVFVFLFLPAILALWWSPLGLPARLRILIAASYLFYGWWDYRFVGLLLISTIVDYAVGGFIHRSESRRAKRCGLFVSLMTNLGLLAYFKYSGFAAESINTILHWFRSGGSLPIAEVVLPIGISFYTFQTLSYSIDIYRGKSKPADSLWHFAAYVSMFPQLIAGPIVRYSELEDQLRKIDSRINWDTFASGIWFFVMGMAQKILFADTVAGLVNPMLADYHALGFFASWFAILGYTVQLYFDFAGYSNMAVGLGLMLGFRFPQNFDSPYRSANIADFWRRWHITLSSFLRDYLYVPLGGNRFGRWLTLRNLLVVMLLGGLWHGAQWTFVLWGLYHGVLLVAYALVKDRISIPRPLAILTTFTVVVLGWAMFRSTDLSMFVHLLQSMTGFNGIEVSIFEIKSAIGGTKAAGILAALLVIVFFCPNVWQIKFRPGYLTSFALTLLFVLCVLRFDSESPFLYFQF